MTQAGVLHDQGGNRYSYETLSERSRLNQYTVSHILSCEVKVDKRSLKIFFAAFGLQLNGDDYLTAPCDLANQTIAHLSHYLNYPQRGNNVVLPGTYCTPATITAGFATVCLSTPFTHDQWQQALAGNRTQLIITTLLNTLQE